MNPFVEIPYFYTLVGSVVFALLVSPTTSVSVALWRAIWWPYYMYRAFRGDR